MRYRARFAGAGHYLPEKVVTNHDLAKCIETSDEWIVQRTGIHQRHMAEEGELTSDLAARAGANALADAGLSAAEVDMIVVGTCTPDLTFPATAVLTQQKLGIGAQAFAFDVNAVCSGFIYGLSIVDNFIQTGQARTALLIGAETITRILNWEDRTTSVLFGDGAGAMVFRAEPANQDSQRGILATCLHSDGRYRDLLDTSGGVSATQGAGYLRMAGREVFKHAIQKMSGIVDECLEKAGMDADAVEWLVPHQANLRIIEGIRQKLNLPEERVMMTIDRHANTSAASIPLAFSEGWQSGRIKPGSRVLMEALGGGFTWGATLLGL